MRRALVLVLALGCHHAPAAPAPVTANVTDVTEDPEVLLRVEATPCMGSCPTYTADLFSDGSLVFVGDQNVVSTGEQHADLGLGVVDEVRRQFRDARFFDLADDGNLPRDPDCSTVNGVTRCTMSGYGCSDTSHTKVTFVDGDRVRMIDDPHCVETDLSRLEDRVLPLLQLHVWIAGRD